jgi:hypothetical protein
MIQALNIKNAANSAPAGVRGEGEALNPETMLEQQGFAKELMASMAEGEMLVQPVEISPEQLLEKPSTLLVPGAQPETTNPKIFDPALTQGVEKLIHPLSVEATAVSEGEVMSPLLKGRSPAIDFAAAEIDPQLMNMEDFVAQKNLAMKKNFQTNAYGFARPQGQQSAQENGLKSTEVVNDIVGTEGSSSSPMNSQQFILEMMSKNQEASKVSDVSGTAKVFDMSQLKTSNSNEIMNQVSDYIVQAKAAKEPTVNMRVNHEELGILDITVQKSGNTQEAVAINIGAHTAEGKNFFQQNSKELFSHLSSAGISVADFKVETPSSSAKSGFDMGSHSQGQGQGQEKHFGSEQNQRRHESDRRQDLWNLFKDKEAA